MPYLPNRSFKNERRRNYIRRDGAFSQSESRHEIFIVCVDSLNAKQDEKNSEPGYIIIKLKKTS